MKLERISDQVDDLKRQLRRQWSKLTTADLDHLDFDVSRLSQVVAKRYSIPAKEAREQVDTFVDKVGTSFREVSQSLGDAAKDLWRNGTEQVADAMHNGSAKASELWSTGREQLSELGERAQRTVRDRPWTSVAVAAGVGMVLGLLLRRRG
jgi:ElaB/YqjD/DUF883 family membrane-anchored ribosome-binding protein